MLFSVSVFFISRMACRYKLTENSNDLQEITKFDKNIRKDIDKMRAVMYNEVTIKNRR